MTELIALNLHKIVQSHAYTVILLGNEEKKFAIYAEPRFGHHLQLALAQTRPLRPSTHNLIESLCKGFDINVLQVVIQDVQETTYFARIFLEQLQGDQKTVLEIDARPSDALFWVATRKIPLFCTKEAFAKTIAAQDTT